MSAREQSQVGRKLTTWEGSKEAGPKSLSVNPEQVMPVAVVSEDMETSEWITYQSLGAGGILTLQNREMRYDPGLRRNKRLQEDY